MLLESEPKTARSATFPRDHFVQFYEQDSALIEAVARYLRKGLESGAAAVMVATPEHEAQLIEFWKEQRFDPSPYKREGRFIVLDAAQTLELFMLDAWPDEKLFDEVIGNVIGDAQRGFGDVVAFGEMVALLWARGLRGAAVRLEDLWNKLANKHRFTLYCAYPMRDCATVDAAAAFREVCHSHSHVIPSETYRDVRDEHEQLRLIAELQQKAAALENEVGTRRRIESMLADRERELADFLENGVYGLHRVGPDGTILWANQAELDMLGYAANEYIGRNIADFYVDKDIIADVLQRLAKGETLRDHAAKLKAKDGTIRHVLVSSNALREDGKLVSSRCFTRDVSDRWLAQEALRERGAVLHLAMQGARMGYWVSDLHRQTMRCSHELATLFGLSGAFEWTLDAFVALIHPDDRQRFRDALRDSIEQHNEFICHFRVRRDLSDWRWFEGRGEAVYNDDATAKRFYGVCMDVTVKKREEQMLAHLAAVVDSAEDAIVSKSLDGIVTSWNGGARRIFGYEAAEMIGKPITSIIPPELHFEEAEILAKVRAGQRVDHYETRRIAKDGSERRVSLSVSPIRDTMGRIVGASKIARRMNGDKAAPKDTQK